MSLIFGNIAIIILFSVKLVVSISQTNKNIFFTDISDDIADYIAGKNYLPKGKELQRGPLIKNIDNDATYLLSKLSDDELIKLLNDQPQKTDFNLNDILKIAFSNKNQDNTLQGNEEPRQNKKYQNNKAAPVTAKKRFRSKSNKETAPVYFKLNHKVVKPNDDNYNAFQTLKNLLDVYLKSKSEENLEDHNKEKELQFDVLTAQLKSLCCKKSKNSQTNKSQYKTNINEYLPSLPKYKNRLNNPVERIPVEYMFLIINDEVRSNASDVLMKVDPGSLNGNSSVLLLGPVTSPLNDEQLRLVMNRISKELIKPEYLSLLLRLSKGVDNNKQLLKNFLFGPQTRRYIKPHRCNHQSKLAKVYGGPKWIICTGYLNINKPSLYD